MDEYLKQEFRNSLSTITADGRRAKVMSKQPRGRLYSLRKRVGFFLLLLFFVLPFIKINGYPFLLLNIFERKFVLFGVLFWSHDNYLLAVLMLTFIVFVILFTVAFGRLFCGWICPQTVFLELVFRRIEYFFERKGSKHKQSVSLSSVWVEKGRKFLKHLVYIAVSLVIILTFSSYLVSYEKVVSLLTSDFEQHKVFYTAIFFFTFTFYGVFAWFREQVCIIACPYGRLQGVLLDSNTIVVAYDYKRGEPRSRYRPLERRAASGKGDCVDCKSCVQVCPTGIDIRNGTQLECINCTACIDACNRVMERIRKPKGLVRYASEQELLTGKKTRVQSVRVIAYGLVLTCLAVFSFFLIFGRASVETFIIRTPNFLYQTYEENRISNLYNIEIVNKTVADIELEIKLLSHKGEIKIVGGESLWVKKYSSAERMFLLYMNNAELSGNNVVRFGIFSGKELINEVETNFLSNKN